MMIYEKYEPGDKVTLEGCWPVEVIRATSLEDDYVVKWLGLRPLGALSAVNGQSTVCFKGLEITRD